MDYNRGLDSRSFFKRKGWQIIVEWIADLFEEEEMVDPRGLDSRSF